MGERSLSITIWFEEEVDALGVLEYTLSEVFSGYIVPHSVRFRYREEDENEFHVKKFGLDPDVVEHSEDLLSEEKLDEKTELTRVDSENVGPKLAEFVRVNQSRIDFFYTELYGSIKTFYGGDDKIVSDFFFREKPYRVYAPIVIVDIDKEDLGGNGDGRASDYRIRFSFIHSSILKSEGGPFSKEPVKQNRRILREKVTEIVDKFQDSYEYSWGTQDGYEEVLDEFSDIPGFDGFE